MVHPYLVYQTLNALTLKQLQQLSFEFKLKIPANMSKKKLLKILMKPHKYIQIAGGRIESTPPIDQEVEFRRLRQLRIEKLEPIVEYYKELCKDGTPIEDQETLDSLTEFQIPFIDPVTQEPLEINDIVFIHNTCWSKKQLTDWVKQSIDKITKPSNPLNKANFSLAEIKELGLNPRDFRHTYRREVPLSPEEIRAQSIRQETEQARRQRIQELQQRQTTQQLRVQQEQVAQQQPQAQQARQAREAQAEHEQQLEQIRQERTRRLEREMRRRREEH